MYFCNSLAAKRCSVRASFSMTMLACGWPAGAKLVESRDLMHQRGWTYFRIAGEVNGETVSGTGRIPFVYDSYKTHRPWLKLQIGNRLKIVDDGMAAYTYNSRGKVLARYEGDNFFAGLGRPWMGVHTIDSVRRDAALRKVEFETSYTAGGSRAQVRLKYNDVELVYSIDLYRDIVEKIEFRGRGGREGELRFVYLQDIDAMEQAFVKPVIEKHKGRYMEETGVMWLLRLAEGTLSK